jgi:hypothetical protein
MKFLLLLITAILDGIFTEKPEKNPLIVMQLQFKFEQIITNSNIFYSL